MSETRTPSVTDEVLSLVPTRDDELAAIAEMERKADTERFITSESVEKHRIERARRNVVYRSLLTADGRLVGYVILVLDPDGERVELRRIVTAERGKGHGVRAMALLEQVCIGQLGRRHVWLDVFDFNPRARHVYERAGYRIYGEVMYAGNRRALLMEKRLHGA